MDRGRAAAADFTGSEPEEIAFGPNMTTLNFLLAHAVARTMEPGDEILVTALDHDANVSPWLLVAEDHDLVVRTAPIRAADATLDEDALEEMIGERTRVVAFTLASNAVGSIPDARASPRQRTGSARWPGLTPCTSPRTGGCGGRSGGSTCCCARRTSSSARTSASRRYGGTWPSRCPRTACARPRSGRLATASSRAPSPTKRSRARRPRSATCARSATATSTTPSS